jgi:alpha-L-rhamnosidase
MFRTILLALLAFCPLMAEEAHFHTARPVWPRGMEKEKNLFVGFRASYPPPAARTTLAVTASTLYRVFLNDEFLGYGPARGPYGYFRVDEWDLSRCASAAACTVAIEVAGYNVNSYYVQDQPSFLQAEVVANGQVIASTAGAGAPFRAAILDQRVRKVQRYSFQRPFSEAYRLNATWDGWRNDARASLPPLDLAVQPAVPLLARRVAYPEFLLRQPLRQTAQGMLRPRAVVDKIWKDRSLTGIGSKLGGFPENELTLIPSIDLQRIESLPTPSSARAVSWRDNLHLAPHSFRIFDLGTNLTGFLGATVTVMLPTRLYFTFDEILSNGDVNFKRMGCVNIVTYDLAPGTYRLESFEPYTLRYLKLMVEDGECDVRKIYLREYANPEVNLAQFTSSDERLNRIFAAGRETFRQNALDLFMDCPSRERAGWLCDSYFTARVAPLLGGNTRVEKNFLENFLLPKSFAGLPEGMLPMCYPADHPNGTFIPNWSLWFVLQLEEYAQRSDDRQMVEALRPKVLALFDYFKGFRNQDGLLENLKSWVFVEWSAANKFTQDVNYPSNMLYAAALASAGRMYGLPELEREAERLRGVVLRQSFDGEFFVDNAVRQNGKLVATRNRSEVCQYFAFYFGVATPSTHAKLWNTLQTQFGPRRLETKLFPEIHPANAFIGNYLRLELLSRMGLSRQIVDESAAYSLYMAERTGTLWEMIDPSASCNHGFASHVVKILYRDVLGLYEVDAVQKKVIVRLADSDLQWCEGRVPVSDGTVSLRWWKQQGRLHCRLDAPAGWTSSLENHTHMPLVGE